MGLAGQYESILIFGGALNDQGQGFRKVLQSTVADVFEPAEKGISVLLLLLNPIIEVPGLQIFRTAGKVRIRHPEPIGKKPLGSGSHIYRFTRNPHLFEAVKIHLMNRNGFIKMVD